MLREAFFIFTHLREGISCHSNRYSFRCKLVTMGDRASSSGEKRKIELHKQVEKLK